MKRCSMPYEHLLDYAEGRADNTIKEQVAAHLAGGCSLCSERLAQMQGLFSALRNMETGHVSEAAIQRAAGLFQERFRKPERPSLPAQFRFDSRSMPAFAGARGGDEETFQLLYKADPYDIDLWQEPQEDGSWYLIGQVLSQQEDTSLTPQSVVLTATDGGTISGTIEGTEFHLHGAAAGTYQLTIRLSEIDIALPDVAVGNAHA